MADIFNQSKRLAYAQRMENGMASATQLIAQLASVVADVNANWNAYVGTSPDPAELLSTLGGFEAMASTLKDAKKAELAVTLTIIAGACPDGVGGYLTLQDLCDEIVATQAP